MCSLLLEATSSFRAFIVMVNAREESQSNCWDVIYNSFEYSVPTQTFLCGSICYTVGSILYFFPDFASVLASSIVWAVGSVLFFIGGAYSLLKQQLSSKVQEKTQRVLNMFAADSFTASGMLFCIGSASYLVNTQPFAIHGDIAWIIGSVFTITGSALLLASDIREAWHSAHVETPTLSITPIN
jgi:cytochrome c oxidase subunit IV